MSTGFYQTQQGLMIDKDEQAVLTYALDWSEWIPTGDSLSTVTWTVAARVNDPTPLVKVNDGIQDKKTFITLSSGQSGKTYTVTAHITTTDALQDARFFRVKVTNRSA